MKTVEIYLVGVGKIEYNNVDYISIERGEALNMDLEKDELYLRLGWFTADGRETATYSLDEIVTMFTY